MSTNKNYQNINQNSTPALTTILNLPTVSTLVHLSHSKFPQKPQKQGSLRQIVSPSSLQTYWNTDLMPLNVLNAGFSSILSFTDSAFKSMNFLCLIPYFGPGFVRCFSPNSLNDELSATSTYPGSSGLCRLRCKASASLYLENSPSTLSYG